jgi:hypothetical protein
LRENETVQKVAIRFGASLHEYFDVASVTEHREFVLRNK